MKHKNQNIDIFWKLNHNIHKWLFYVSLFTAFCGKDFINLRIFTNILLSIFYNSWDFYKNLVILRQFWNVWGSRENFWDLAALMWCNLHNPTVSGKTKNPNRAQISLTSPKYEKWNLGGNMFRIVKTRAQTWPLPYKISPVVTFRDSSFSCITKLFILFCNYFISEEKWYFVLDISSPRKKLLLASELHCRGYPFTLLEWSNFSAIF